MSSKCESLACIECVPGLCTHRPSLLPTSCLVRSLEIDTVERLRFAVVLSKLIKLDDLEEVKVVTRFP